MTSCTGVTIAGALKNLPASGLIERERTGVCEMTVKRTRLCYWIARLAKPGVQSSNTSRVRFTVISHTPVRSRFYHIYSIQTELRWLLANEFNTKQLTCSYIFFKFAICSIALLSLGETCHLKGLDMVMVWRSLLLLSCYDCDSTRHHYDVMRFKYVLWRRTMHERVMNIYHQIWIAQGWFIIMIRTPSKQWGVCDNLPNPSHLRVASKSTVSNPRGQLSVIEQKSLHV